MDFPQLSNIVNHHQIIQSVIGKLPTLKNSIFQTLSKILQISDNHNSIIFQSVIEKL